MYLKFSSFYLFYVDKQCTLKFHKYFKIKFRLKIIKNTNNYNLFCSFTNRLKVQFKFNKTCLTGRNRSESFYVCDCCVQIQFKFPYVSYVSQILTYNSGPFLWCEVCQLFEFTHVNSVEINYLEISVVASKFF